MCVAVRLVTVVAPVHERVSLNHEVHDGPEFLQPPVAQRLRLGNIEAQQVACIATHEHTP